MFNERVKGDLEASQTKFALAITGEDELGAVIRAHIYIENTLESMIRSTLHQPQILRIFGLDYEKRVNLAIAIGLDPAYKPALKCIGTLRNKFAHNLDAVITKEDANNLYTALPPDLKTAVTVLYLEKLPNAGALAMQAPMARVRVYLIAIWAELAVLAEIAAAGET